MNVEVNADFDDTVEETTHTAKPDPKTAAQTRNVTDRRHHVNRLPTTAASQVRLRKDPIGKSRRRARRRSRRIARTTNRRDTDNVVGIEDSRIVKKGYTPKEVWATVSIPGSLHQEPVDRPQSDGDCCRRSRRT